MTYGPLDFIALEFQSHNLRGEVLPALLDLVNKKVVRVVDLVIIQKKDDGSYEAHELKQADAELLEIFDPLEVDVSGLIQVEDIEAIAEQMDDDTTAALLLIENLWAVRFKEAVLRADGRLIEQIRIPMEEVEEMLAIFDAAET